MQVYLYSLPDRVRGNAQDGRKRKIPKFLPVLFTVFFTRIFTQFLP